MLLRRSATLLSRLGPQLAAAESGGPAWAPQSAAALQLLGHTQHCDGSSEHQGRQGGAWQAAQRTSVRHLSLWPGGSKKHSEEQQQQQQQPDTAAAGEDFGASDAAAAATGLDASSGGGALAAAAADSGGGGLAAAGGAPGVADLFTASAIIAAAAGAEADALEAAREDSWIVTRGVQSLVVCLHGALGLEWWQSIMAATCAMRLATLPLMLAQVKNTYRMSQVGRGLGAPWAAGSGRRRCSAVCSQGRLVCRGCAFHACGLTPPHTHAHLSVLQARPEMEELMRYFKEDQARGNTEAAVSEWRERSPECTRAERPVLRLRRAFPPLLHPATPPPAPLLPCMQLQHQQRILAVWKKYDCNPLKSLMGIFVQAPIFIGFFSALRGFAAHKVGRGARWAAVWGRGLPTLSGGCRRCLGGPSLCVGLREFAGGRGGAKRRGGEGRSAGACLGCRPPGMTGPAGLLHRRCPP